MKAFLRIGAFTLAALLLTFCATRKWATQPDQAEIVLPPALQNPKLEFSSMLWRGSELWLIPQHPQALGGEIFALAAADLRNALKGKAVPSYRTIRVTGLDAVRDKIGAAIYEGIEATAIVDNRIFFTLETKPSSKECYLVAGKIDGDRVTVDPGQLLALPKLKLLNNAGYESLAWSPQMKKLLAFFEYNKEDAFPAAMVIDTSLRLEAPVMLPMLPFRLTDIAPVGKGTFLGINFAYKGAKEFGEYIGRDSTRIQASEPSLYGKSLKNTCYSRIVRLDILKNGAVSWTKARDISFACDNWEGIAPFLNGVLLVNDEYTDTGTGTRLKWFRLN